MMPYPMSSDPTGRPSSLDIFLATLSPTAVQRPVFERVVGRDAPRTVPSKASLLSFEFELESETVTEPRELDVYHPIRGPTDMIVAYRHSRDVYRLRNTYELFPLPDSLGDLACRLESSRSAFPGDEKVASDSWPGEIASANRCASAFCSYKPDADGISLGLVDASDLVRFLDRFAYPAHLRTWVGDNHERLDHLAFDLGFDYAVVDGAVRILETGIYGYF